MEATHLYHGINIISGKLMHLVKHLYFHLPINISLYVIIITIKFMVIRQQDHIFHKAVIYLYQIKQIKKIVQQI